MSNLPKSDSTENEIRLTRLTREKLERKVDREPSEEDFETYKSVLVVEFVFKDGETLTTKVEARASDFIESFEKFLNNKELLYFRVWCKNNGGVWLLKEELKYFRLVSEAIERS